MNVATARLCYTTAQFLLTVFPMDLVLSFLFFFFSPEKLKGPKRQTQNSGLD